MSFAFDEEGGEIRLQMSENFEFSFLILDYPFENYILNKPHISMISENDDRLLHWLAGQMAMAFVKMHHGEYLQDIPESQHPSVVVGFLMLESGESNRIRYAIKDLEELVYPKFKQHLTGTKVFEIRRARITELYSHSELFRMRKEVEGTPEEVTVLKRVLGPTRSYTDEQKKEIEIWALDHPEHVKI